MRSKKEIDKYKRIEQISEVSHDVLNQALAEMKNRSEEPQKAEMPAKRKMKKGGWISIMSAAACLLIVAIVLPFAIGGTKKMMNSEAYTFSNLIKTEIVSIQQFNAENGTKYKNLALDGSKYYQYNSNQGNVLLSQNYQNNESVIVMWVCYEFIMVDILNEYSHLSDEDSVNGIAYSYQLIDGGIKCKIYYNGIKYQIEFKGYGIEEAKNLIATLF